MSMAVVVVQDHGRCLCHESKQGKQDEHDCEESGDYPFLSVLFDCWFNPS